MHQDSNARAVGHPEGGAGVTDGGAVDVPTGAARVSDVDGTVGAARTNAAPGAQHAETESGPFAELDTLPVAEHVARFDAVHDSLRARLAGEPGIGGSA